MNIISDLKTQLFIEINKLSALRIPTKIIVDYEHNTIKYEYNKKDKIEKVVYSH